MPRPAGCGPAPAAAVAEFARRVRQARRQAGLTQFQTGIRTGVQPSYISGIETGKKQPAMGMLLALSRALDVDPCHLVRGLHLIRDGEAS